MSAKNGSPPRKTISAFFRASLTALLNPVPKAEIQNSVEQARQQLERSRATMEESERLTSAVNSMSKSST